MQITISMILAGAVGFEPANDGVKVRCVTVSPYPYLGATYQIRTGTAGLEDRNAYR